MKTIYKVYETHCHPNKWKVSPVIWAKGTFHDSRDKAEAEAGRLNSLMDERETEAMAINRGEDESDA
jgi:hypothetical protein